MKNLIQKLHEDHKNFASLLNVLTKQVNILDSGHRWDDELVNEIVQYMRDYADASHHPAENRLYQEVLNKGDSNDISLNILLEEHQDLAKQTEELFALLTQMNLGGFVDRETVVAEVRMYVASLKMHMDVEESEVFTKLAHMLSEKDLNEIAKQVELASDPLFAQVLNNEYALIRAHIEC